MLDAEHQLKSLVRQHRQGSHATQRAQRDTARAFVKALDENGFSRTVRQRIEIKEKHVLRAVGAWREAGVSDRVICNRLAHLRRFCEWQGRPGMLKGNDRYLPDRDHNRLPRESKAIDRQAIDPSACRTDYARASLRLQTEFGIRRKEALMIQPRRSSSDSLVLHGPATKGGRPRSIEARTEAQRAAIAYAKAVAGGGSLIPPGRTYASWRAAYRHEAERAGVPNGSTHAIRHAYAQARYAEESGQAAPLSGGPWRADMDADERAADGDARDVVSAELGHGRRAVSAQYLGGAKAPDEGGDETAEEG